MQKVLGKIITILLITAFFAPVSVLADEVSITNNIRVEADSGGNSASDGVIEQGISKAGFFLQTFVNGELVEEVNEEVVSETGEAVIEKNVGYTSEDGSVEVNTDVLIQTGSADEVQAQAEIPVTEEPEPAEKQSGLASFFQTLIKYVVNIFT